MSELRLYCDLLLKQVNKIKDSEERGDSAEVRFFDELEKIKEADGKGKALWSTDAAIRLALAMYAIMSANIFSMSDPSPLP